MHIITYIINICKNNLFKLFEKLFTFVSNGDSLDWKDPSVDQIVQNCTQKLQPGSIILLHNGATNTPEALPKIIEAIQAQGYKIVPISKLLLKGNYTTDVQGKMCKAE